MKLEGVTPSGRTTWVLVPAVLLVLSAATVWGQAGYSGGSGTPEDPYLISTTRDLLDLAADSNDWYCHFKLTADIDMAEVPRDTVCMIGDAIVPFRGSFDGAGMRILHYTCICPDRDRVGLFGHIRALGGGVRDLCLIDPNIEAETGVSVGALVGHLGTGTVSGCRVEGAHVRGEMAVGGLVGWNYATIEKSTAQAEVRGRYSVGGLVGLCGWDAIVRDCSANALVTGTSRVGGLAGACTLTILEWSSATGSASGSSNVGGLVGCNEGATILNCYSTTSTKGDSVVGGFAGRNGPSCDCSIGSFSGVIRNGYSTGRVTGVTDTGGFVGRNEPNCFVDGSYWDTETSGMMSSAEGTGLPTTLMQTQSTFVRAGWNFSRGADTGDCWIVWQEPHYPIFTWQFLKGDLDGDGNPDPPDPNAPAASQHPPGEPQP